MIFNNYTGTDEYMRIPDDVTEIGDGAFAFSRSLHTVIMDGVEEIGDNAFAWCRSLVYVRMGSVKRIGTRAFHRCDSLEIAAFPETLRYIGDEAFSSVRPGLVIPRNMEYIGRDCFAPSDKGKTISIYRSSLYAFRNYFLREPAGPDDEDEHFYMRESAMDVKILDDDTGEMTGFLPLFTDIYRPMSDALVGAFRPDNTFDYSVLDTVFPAEMKWNRRCRDRLAVMRLKYPYDLSRQAGDNYYEYLERHAERIAARAVDGKDIGILTFLFDNNMAGRKSIPELVRRAIALGDSECTAFLLARQSEMGADEFLIDEL